MLGLCIIEYNGYIFKFWFFNLARALVENFLLTCTFRLRYACTVILVEKDELLRLVGMHLFHLRRESLATS